MIRLLLSLSLLVGVGAGVDRLAASTADGVVADQVQQSQHLAERPEVHIGGFPFLTQVFNGVYPNVGVQVYNLHTDKLTVDQVDVTLHGVHLPLSDVVARKTDQIRVDSAAGVVRVSYDSLDSAVSGARFSDGPGSRLDVAATISYAGQHVPAHGVADVTIQHNQIVVVSKDITVAGRPVPAAAQAAAASQLSYTVSMPKLPFPIHLTDVTTDPEGIVITATARAFLLRG